MATAKNKIVLCEGLPEERTLYLKRPKGRIAREKMPRVLAFMSELTKRQTESKATDIDAVQELVDQFWSKDEFENDLVPFVLQMEDEAGRKWLDEEGTPLDIIEAFSSAASYLIEESFSRQEVQAAMGKSNVEVPAEKPTKK